MAKRLPSEPPIIAGFNYVSPLGTGGFADVFLFAGEMPRRNVAVKVLLQEFADNNFLRLFKKEADLMAALSAHPAIVTIFEASISADGRPYIVMEHCPSSYAGRYRNEKISVSEVLNLGVKIGSALETAHRAGVLHRDLKPANILISEYGAPLLSDFGIAKTINKVATNEMLAMSIPWSAPEIIAETSTGTVASEVWGFGATLYSLLAGISPFEKPGKGMNEREKLKQRILKAKYSPINRDDISERLQNVLARSMHKNPGSRFASMAEMVTALQLVQKEMGLGVTSQEIAQNNWVREVIAEPEDIAEPKITAEPESVAFGVHAGSRVQYVSERKRAAKNFVLAPEDDGIVEADSKPPFYRKKQFLISISATVLTGTFLMVLKISGVL